jgi:hypothetical protein
VAWKLEPTQAKEGKPKKENSREKMERKEGSGIMP